MTNLLGAIDDQRAALAPAGKGEIKSACKTLVAYAEATGIRCPDLESLFAVWSTICRDMPGHLLALGLAEVLKRWTNTFCLPAPGAVWEQIEPVLTRMRADLAKLENARWSIAETPQDVGERNPSAETDEVIAKTLRILAANGGGKRRAA